MERARSVRALIKKFEDLGEKNAGRSGPNARRNSGRRNASRIHQESHPTAVPVAAAAATENDDGGPLGKLLREEYHSANSTSDEYHSAKSTPGEKFAADSPQQPSLKLKKEDGVDSVPQMELASTVQCSKTTTTTFQGYALFVASSSPVSGSVQQFSLYLFSHANYLDYMERCSYFNQLKGHTSFHMEQHHSLTISVEVVCVNGDVLNTPRIYPAMPTEIEYSVLREDLLCIGYKPLDYFLVAEEKIESLHIMLNIKGKEKSSCAATFDPKANQDHKWLFSKRQSSNVDGLAIASMDEIFPFKDVPVKDSSARARRNFPEDDDEPSENLIKAIFHLGQSMWRKIGIHLSVDTTTLDQIEQDYSDNEVRLKEVINSWMLKANKGTDITVRVLLFACKEAGVGRHSITKKYSELCR